jgi:hypothetical protein
MKLSPASHVRCALPAVSVRVMVAVLVVVMQLPCLPRRVRMLGLQIPDSDGGRDSKNQRDRQPDAVVRMELHLGKKIG